MEIIDGMVNFMYASIPALITLLISSVILLREVYCSLYFYGSTGECNNYKNILIPLIVLSTIISIVDNVSDKIQITRFSAFLKNITQWSIGIILTVFVAIVSLQGSLGAVVDV